MPFHALSSAEAYEIESNADLATICVGLVSLGHDHPFQGLDKCIEEQERLDFLIWGHRHPQFHFDKGHDYLDAARQWALDHKRPDPLESADFAIRRAFEKKI